MATALEERAAATRERAQAGAQPSDQDIQAALRKGGARRAASTFYLGPASRVVAFGGHNAAQDELKKKFNVTEGQARRIEHSGGVRRGTGTLIALSAGAAVATGGASLVVGGAVAGAGLLVKRSGDKKRMETARQEVARPQGRRTARDMQGPTGPGRGRGGRSMATA